MEKEPRLSKMIRIVLTGAECTGKTTLAKALSGYYGEPWTAEYARLYVEQVTRPLTAHDVEPIARGQLAIEDMGLNASKQIILHDTNLLSTIIYANHYYGVQLDWLNDTFLRRNYTLYLLTTPNGVEWEADNNQRESPKEREKLHKKFQQSLFRLQLPTLELDGTQDERFGEAIVAIDKLLQN